MTFKFKFITYFLTVLLLNDLAHASSFTVLLDPGHGGSDQGTSYQNIKESHLTLKIAKKILELNQPNSNFTINLTRTKNQYLSLSDRTNLVKEQNPDLFVSIHINSLPSTFFKGMELYFTENLSDLSGENTDIVAEIKNDLINLGKTRKSLEFNRALSIELKALSKSPQVSIKKNAFYVLEHSKTPSVLVELGFLSNEEERKLLLDDNYQNEIALAVFKSLEKAKERHDKNLEM